MAVGQNRLLFGIIDREGIVRNYGVAEHKIMFSIRVFKEVEDSFFLHESADKVKIRLSILDGVFSLGVDPLQMEAEIGEPKVSEDILDDLWDGLILKDADIRSPGQEP